MSARPGKALLALFLKSLAQRRKQQKRPIAEIVVTVDDATLVGRQLDALKHDPNARRQPRDRFDVDAGAPTTAPAVHTPATLGVGPIGRLRPTHGEHQAIRHAIVEAWMNGCDAFDRRCAEPRSGWRGAAPAAMVESVESRIRLIRGDQ